MYGLRFKAIIPRSALRTGVLSVGVGWPYASACSSINIYCKLLSLLHELDYLTVF